MQKLTNFLMFEGHAEEAMNFYISVFDNSSITDIKRYEAGGPGKEGSVMMAKFTLNGLNFMCIDSFVKHEFSFTPAFSLHVDCGTEAEVEKLFNALSSGGAVFMPLDVYPFSKKYVWFSDKFGISWQLNFNQ